MRLVHVVDYFHTDVGYQEFYLANAQAEAGHQVRVVTSRHRHHALGEVVEDEGAGAEKLERAGVDVVRLASRQLGHDRAWLIGLSEAVAAFSPDAVHCHTAFGPTTVRTAKACRALGVPLLVDNHIQETGAPASTSTASRIAYAAYRSVFGRYLRRSVGAWVTDAPEKSEFLARRLGLAPSRISLVPLGFDPEVFHFDDARRVATRSARGWAEDRVVAVTGKLRPDKKVEWAAAACERLAASCPARLVLAGSIDSDYLDVVRAAAPALSASGRLDVMPMLGWSELADLYLGADVVIFPRLTSISIFEALGTGVATVLPDDEFGVFLHGLQPSIRLGRPDRFHTLLEPASDRHDFAQQAAATFSWPVISAEFVRRYEALR